MTATITSLQLQVKALRKRYGEKVAVDGVDLSVETGEIVGLLGPNGAGKTTTFYMIAGMIRPDEGDIYLGQVRLTKMPVHQRARLGIGYLPQEPSVFRKLTVRQNIQAIVELLPIPSKERRHRIETHLKELDLERVSNQKAYTLSGGERRRLEITRALIHSPRFLLLDEPFSGVDPISVEEVQQIVLQLKEKGIGVVITDHNVRETLRIVDRAYLLHEGRVLAQGTREYLANDPESRMVYLGKNFSL